MKHLSTFEKRAEKNTNFIEELDPVRKRRMITQSRSLSGVMPSPKNGSDIWFESALERDFAILLEHRPDIAFYEEQPLTIEYFKDSKTRRYTPDFLIHFANDSKPILCEIKYRSEIRKNFAKLKPKFKAAIDYCKSQGWEFNIITEDYIRTAELANINFLERYNYNELDGACYKMMLCTINDLGDTTPQEFMLTVQDANFNMKGRLLYALWYGIKTGAIGCDLLNEKISMTSEIWIAKKLEFNLVKE